MQGSNSKTIAIGVLAMAATFACADTVEVTVNGTQIDFQGTQPQTVNGRVLVPLRGVFEALGANVLWDPSTQSIMANSGDRHVKLRIGVLEANVNGRIVAMDVPPQIQNGSTLVPLRFLSQALGASVDWEPQQNLVAINSVRSNEARAQRLDDGHDQDRSRPTPPPTPPPTIIVQNVTPGPVPAPPARRDPPYVVHSYTVIPITLDQTVSSSKSQEGDRVTATITGNQGRYLELPKGTLVEGTIRRVRAANGDSPGMLVIRFTDVLLPDGANYPITGTVGPLNDPNIIKAGDGRFIAKNSDDVKSNITQDAAIGAGAGLVIGSLHARAIGGAATGGVLGAIVGALTPRRHHDNNVQIDQGEKLGLILGQDLRIEHRDLR